MLHQKYNKGSGCPPEPTTFKSLILSFRNALHGLCDCLRSERNLRIHITATLWVTMLGAAVGLTKGEWAALVVCCGVVITAELFNTAVEATVDLLSPDYHPIARRAKDVAAAGVLIGAVFAVLTGIIIFWDSMPQLVFLLVYLPNHPAWLVGLSLFLLAALVASWLFIFRYPRIAEALFKSREE